MTRHSLPGRSPGVSPGVTCDICVYERLASLFPGLSVSLPTLVPIVPAVQTVQVVDRIKREDLGCRKSDHVARGVAMILDSSRSDAPRVMRKRISRSRETERRGRGGAWHNSFYNLSARIHGSDHGRCVARVKPFPFLSDPFPKGGADKHECNC